DFEAELRLVIASRCRDRVPDALLQRIADAIHEESRRHGPGGGPPPGDTASGDTASGGPASGDTASGVAPGR
ncbi:MAG TPA: hypothetical protein VHX40_01280, partial [Acidimicrobiales bacterium]|nr:hypothetical protein [Acidimicrobiales bacterium]